MSSRDPSRDCRRNGLRRPEINHNFYYYYQAYEEVKRNLARLITSGQLWLAMELALELMKQGAIRSKMSDEGLMTDDIESCLNVAI